ncbi:MAG: LysE family translocator [Bacteroidota bacterium]|jgi:threonine/homoserine/homoserine lactone efflux protein|nr:LysE family transporter [Ignavibacteria bacterium]HEX2962478.1 LysE family transporter [Ignavibacteriales bacterium]MCU7500850.1 LysE family transporter [Ignavibacteria bacterium]MCU7511771.1 LysE family transporter [Ignavibacteria bacterium]MCU7520671.1 LysE family transporter [Ignavibacteria bacterium]
MEFIIFLKGVLIGFVMAVPLGPIGIMCIRKTLTEGRLRGLVIGFGAATADLLYGSIAAFGLTLVSDLLIREKIWIRLVGGALLLFLGVKTFLKMPADPKFNVHASSIIRSYLTTVFLTLTNPLAIFAFIAVFAALGLGYDLSNYSASALVSGVFLGSALWFFMLSSGVMFFRKKFEVKGLIWVNKIAGVLIVVSGFIAIGSLL